MWQLWGSGGEGCQPLAVMVSRTETEAQRDALTLFLLAVAATGTRPFDLLVAADVFVYIGELQPVLQAAAAVSTDR